MSDTMLGWHWVASDRRLRFGARARVEVGQTYTAIGPLVLCENGVHASRRVLDALRYAPGPVICRVRLSGEIREDTDKAVARARTVLWMADATVALHEFALVMATDCLLRERADGREPDPRSWAALDAKRAWLNGRITDEQLSAARSAAWSAARNAAGWSAAGSAAESAAEGAARNAAWSVAEGAARNAAGWSAAWSAAEEILTTILMALRRAGEGTK